MSTAIPKSVGRYEIVGEVGRGAMGVVYKATDPNIGRMVALKTMRVDVHGADEEEILRRFKHEAKLAGTMSHPSIVTVHDAGEDSGVFFMAMEYLEGVTLHRVLKDKHVLPLPRVIALRRKGRPHGKGAMGSTERGRAIDRVRESTAASTRRCFDQWLRRLHSSSSPH